MTMIGVLLPNVSSAEEYHKVLQQLTQTANDSMAILNDDTPEKDFRKTMIQSTAFLIYQEFSIFASQQNRATYMTWNELRSELSNLSELEEAIKYLLQKGLLKEGYIEINEDKKM